MLHRCITLQQSYSVSHVRFFALNYCNKVSRQFHRVRLKAFEIGSGSQRWQQRSNVKEPPLPSPFPAETSAVQMLQYLRTLMGQCPNLSFRSICWECSSQNYRLSRTKMQFRWPVITSFLVQEPTRNRDVATNNYNKHFNWVTRLNLWVSPINFSVSSTFETTHNIYVLF